MRLDVQLYDISSDMPVKTYHVGSNRPLFAIGSAPRAYIRSKAFKNGIEYIVKFHKGTYFLYTLGEPGLIQIKKFDQQLEVESQGIKIKFSVRPEFDAWSYFSSLQPCSIKDASHFLLISFYEKRILASKLVTKSEFEKFSLPLNLEEIPTGEAAQQFIIDLRTIKSPLRDSFLSFGSHLQVHPFQNREDIKKEILISSKKTSAKLYLGLGILLFALAILFYLMSPSEQTIDALKAQKIVLPEQVKPVVIEKIKRKESSPLTSQGAASGVNSSVDTSGKHSPKKESRFSRLDKLISRFGTTAVPTNKVDSVSNPGAQNVLNEIDQSAVRGSLMKGIGGLSEGSGQGRGKVGWGTQDLGQGLQGFAGKSSISSPEEETLIEGGLDPEEIAKVIRRHLGEILHCYERQLALGHDIEGKIVVNFLIQTSGKVDASKILQSSLNHSPTEGCILKRITTWKFPEPRGGRKVSVTYPFILQRQGDTK